MSIDLEKQDMGMKTTGAVQDTSSRLMAVVFNWMAAGLGLTGAVALLAAYSPLGLSLVRNPMLLIGLMIAEVVMVVVLSARYRTMSAAAATGCFLAYSALNGVTLSIVLLAYTGASVASTFFITAGMFGAMALYGTMTKRDLTGLGSFCMMGLWGVILAMVVNFFMHSARIDWMITLAGIIVFVGLTAYDTQKIRVMGEQIGADADEAAFRKVAIMGALALYLDFINLFLHLLSLLGNQRD